MDGVYSKAIYGQLVVIFHATSYDWWATGRVSGLLGDMGYLFQSMKAFNALY